MSSVVYQELSNPHSLRPHGGWNLRTLDTPSLKEGKFLEVRNGEDRKKIILYDDGNLIVIGSLGEDFLGWRREEDAPRIHSLAIAEFSYEFAELYRKIIQSTDIPENTIIDIVVEIRGVSDLKSKPLLIPKPLSGLWFDIDGKRLEQDFSECFELKTTNDLFDPRYVAYEIVRKIYRRCGFLDDTHIAYSSMDERGISYIDKDQISKIN